jgi:hypothetical protein
MSTESDSTSELGNAYVAAWNAHDAHACGALFTDDGVREWQVKPLAGVSRFKGRVAVVEGIQEFMTAIPDVHVELHNVWEIPGGLVVEWRVLGTHQADWDVWTAQGDAGSFSGISVCRIQDDRVADERMCFDARLMAANWRPPAIMPALTSLAKRRAQRREARAG